MKGRHAGELGALGEDGVDDLAEPPLAGQRDDLGEGLPERAVSLLGGARHRRIEGLGAQQRGFALIEHGELRGDLRFEREALQQALAEPMDGVDLEPATRFEHAREQPPGLAQIGRLGLASRKLRKRGAELVLRQDRPGRKRLQQLVLHLGRRGLGVGQAEDGFGLRARRAAAASTA